MAEKFKFNFCATLENDLLDEKTNTVFVATRHDSHAKYVIKALEHNKHVFVEKPLCLKESELATILEVQQQSKTALMIGFNRRFSPLTKKIKNVVGTGPMSMIYRINAESFQILIQDLKQKSYARRSLSFYRLFNIFEWKFTY